MGKKKAPKRRKEQLKEILEWISLILGIISTIYTLLRG